MRHLAALYIPILHTTRKYFYLRIQLHFFIMKTLLDWGLILDICKRESDPANINKNVIQFLAIILTNFLILGLYSSKSGRINKYLTGKFLGSHELLKLNFFYSF